LKLLHRALPARAGINLRSGPFADKGFPEIVDFNVLIPYQKKESAIAYGCSEQLAKEVSDYVTLAVGITVDMEQHKECM